jgi:hypothetical protein
MSDAAAPELPAQAEVHDLLSLRRLAAALGVDPAQLCKESKRGGFPAKVGELYSLAQVTAWRQQNVRRKKFAPAATDPFTKPAQEGDGGRKRSRGVAPAATEPPDPKDESVLEILQSARASPLEISRAAVQLTARRVAKAHLKHGLGPNDLEALKKCLQELRQGEAADIELGQIRGSLVPLWEVKAIVGECCARLVQVCSVLENALAAELAIWMADAHMAALSADERKLIVRAFVQKTCNEIRAKDADDVVKMLAAAAGEKD